MHVSTQKNYNLQIKKKLSFIIDFINKKLCYSQTPTYLPTSLRTH